MILHDNTFGFLAPEFGMMRLNPHRSRSRCSRKSPPPRSNPAVIIEQGRLLDFIDGVTQRKETPEEYVRQEIAKSLVREYGYPKCDIKVEFTLRLGSRKPRADLVIFEADARHEQASARIMVECKEAKVKPSDRKDGVGQLQSYLSACPNAHFGLWTNGVDRFCFRKVEQEGRFEFEDIADIPGYGQSAHEAERPRFDQLKPASSDALLFAFRRCHNYIAGNQGLQKSQAFWELLKLIFCKIHDERESREVSFYTAANERGGINGPLKVKEYEAGKPVYRTVKGQRKVPDDTTQDIARAFRAWLDQEG